MERLSCDPRPNWTAEIERLGFDFYLMDGIPYWRENGYYRFTAAEIDGIEAAANTLHRLCMFAVDRIVSERLYPLLGIDPEIGEQIAASWQRKDPAVYGRFDLMYDGYGPPKLLEYNANTPTSLFEASIVQWNWREQKFPKSDQFNFIHEALTERWRELLVGRPKSDTMLYVTTATPMPEDETTVQYIGRTAHEAGWRTKFIPIQEIGWDEGRKAFVDLDGSEMRRIFALYPWEWLVRDDFGAHIKPSGSLWIEPMWKMLLSNKGILPILWEMFPEHDNLLAAYRDPAPLKGSTVVRKPLLGREGNNIEISDGNKVLAETVGPYTESGYVYQAYVEPRLFGEWRANLGVWMVHDRSCGMGVREDQGLIISNGSWFVPHVFD